MIGAPHMDEVPGFDKADYSLRAVNLALWEGFIFVNLDENAMPLEEWFAPLNGKFSHWNMSILRSAKRIEYDVRANWKLMFENYSECYHCPGVHPMLAKVSPYDSAENDLSEGPFLGGFMKINQGSEPDHERKRVRACRWAGSREQTKRKRTMHGLVFYYSIFPNMLLSVASGIRDGASALAAVAGANPDRVRLVLSSGRVQSTRFQTR